MEEYVAWLCFLKNLGVEVGHQLTTKQDAELILKELLKAKTNPLLKEIQEKKPTDLPKPTGQFLKKLKENTDRVRERKPYFVYDTETLGDSFSIKSQLEMLPLFILKEMGKDLKIKGYSKARIGRTYALRQGLQKHPQIEEELLKMRAKYGKDKFSKDNS